MAVVMVCPKCGSAYGVEEGMEPRCECGTELQAQAATALRECPGCGKAVAEGAVICVNCGHDFRSGQAVSSQPEARRPAREDVEDDIPFFEKWKPLIKLGIVAVLLLAAGLIYMISTGPHFGISKKNPLGTQAKMVAYLTEIGLVKEQESEWMQYLGDVKGQFLFYRDAQLETNSKGMFRESLFVLVDGNGKVCAVGGDFTTTDMGPTGGRITGFMRTLWTDLGQKEEKESQVMNTSAVYGRWTKSVNSGVGLMQTTHHEMVVVLKGGAISEKLVDEMAKEDPVIQTSPTIVIPDGPDGD